MRVRLCVCVRVCVCSQVNSLRQEFLQHITEEEEQEIPRLLRVSVTHD